MVEKPLYLLGREKTYICLLEKNYISLVENHFFCLAEKIYISLVEQNLFLLVGEKPIFAWWKKLYLLGGKNLYLLGGENPIFAWWKKNLYLLGEKKPLFAWWKKKTIFGSKKTIYICLVEKAPQHKSYEWLDGRTGSHIGSNTPRSPCDANVGQSRFLLTEPFTRCCLNC